jgi:hypothetical protein
MNRPIRFSGEDIEDLLATSYGQKQTFLVLSLLYPWVDYRNAFHLDHIHPQTAFTPKKLRQAGVPEGTSSFASPTTMKFRISRFWGTFRILRNLVCPSESGSQNNA